MNNLTLKQKIGQMLLVPIEGTELDAATKAHLQKHHIGNIIHFAKNLTDYKSIRKLNDSLQDAIQESCGVPAFISTDQEGGMVARAYSGATHYPSNMAITAANAAHLVEKMGEMVALELKTLGINLNHAPVLDVNNNPNNPVIGIRSYSDKAEVVAQMATDYIRGLQRGGVLANAKHFPGHGDTNKDSHLDLPSINHGIARLNEVELVPFKAAFADGIDSIMTAHIVFKELDDLPATLSPKILGGLLRKQLGFNGLILTDSMTMEAIRNHYGLEKGCIMAINAGVDILCMNADRDGQARCANAILQAVENGEIPLEKIDTAVERILKYKAIYAQTDVPQPEEVYPAHEALADEISEKSITLVKGNDSLLPLKADDNIFAISPPPSTANIADDTLVVQETFCKKAAAMLGCNFAEISTDPNADEIAQVVQQAVNADVILYASYNAIQFPGQIVLFDALKQAGKKVVLVSLRVPYDITKMQNADAYIAAYEYTNRAVNNTLKALAGELPFNGVLPIELC